MKDIHQKLLAAFDVEHREHLDQIRLFLSGLSDGTEGSSPISKTELAEAFRAAHSLKGAARVVDLKAVTEIAHRLEAIFLRIQSQKQTITTSLLTCVSEALNRIEDIVIASRKNESQPDASPLIKDLDDLLADPGDPIVGITLPVEPLKVRLTLSSGPSPTPAPAAAAVRPKAYANITSLSPTFATMRLRAEHFDRLIRTAGEVINFSRNQEENAAKLKNMSEVVRNMEKEWSNFQKQSAKYSRQTSIDPDTEKLVKYLGFVETQIRGLGRQLRSVASDQKNDNFALRILSQQLQEDVHTARLVPASDVFESFGKMMRDLAKDENKFVDFRTVGLDIEADRVVLQALKDPVMHILRNALSHGIETSPQRALNSKSQIGNISLRLEIAGRRLIIIVADDGQGLDVEAISQKALEVGLYTAQELEDMPVEELWQLIFHPGFSTAQDVTEISGRGVGLSVVKDTIERLQGEVVIDSSPGTGCQFKISVPLSISARRLLLMVSQGQTFAIPTHAVQCVQRAKIQDLVTVEDRPVIIVGGLYIPIMPLSQLLHMDTKGLKFNSDNLTVAIIKFGDKRLAVAVDGLIGEREGLVKNLGAPLHRSARFEGGLILDRGTLALVVTPFALFEAFHQLRHSHPSDIMKKKVEHKKLRILVVDDSFTTRILEKSILEAKGYQVDIAVDGVEALSFLEKNLVDLVITDIEMPRMDGLTLLQKIRSQSRTAKVPVIIVSSRDQREELERGMKLGADAYLLKQEFSQKILLDTIRQVV
ncbi:MAG: response regulator [Oligoflexus sp.]|nr:response regulator [Oligoflexus sp.]